MVSIAGNVLRYSQPMSSETDGAFWFETTLTIPSRSDYQQFHATIRDSSPDKSHIGKVIITLFKMDNEQLFLGVIDSREEPPSGAVDGDWNDVMDEYVLSRASNSTREGKPVAPDISSKSL